MNDLSERKRNYQAEVHFALGAVIQGVTVAALGNEVAAALRELPFPGAGWVFVAAAQSLFLCIIFWYRFMDNYYFGFRVINLTAMAHFLFACLYLVLGILQLMAIGFLDLPRVWMSCYVLLVAATLAGSWLSSSVTVIKESEVRKAFAYDPGSRAFLVTFVLSAALLLAWFLIPGIDTGLFRALAFTVSGLGLAVFTVYSIRVFQRHLDVH
jgi:hypothetical protein